MLSSAVTTDSEFGSSLFGSSAFASDESLVPVPLMRRLAVVFMNPLLYGSEMVPRVVVSSVGEKLTTSVQDASTASVAPVTQVELLLTA